MTIKCDIWCYTLRQEEEEAWGCTGVADHYQCQASLFCLHTLYHHPRQHHQHVFRSLNGKTKIMQQTNKWCSWSSQKTFLRGRWQWASIGHFVFLFVMQWEISINCNDDDSVFFMMTLLTKAQVYWISISVKCRDHLVEIDLWHIQANMYCTCWLLIHCNAQQNQDSNTL